MLDPSRHGQDQLAWACGCAPGRAAQILSSSRTRTTTAMAQAAIRRRGLSRYVVQTGSVAPPYPTLVPGCTTCSSCRTWPAMRMGDMSGCGAPIIMGAPTVMIGG